MNTIVCPVCTLYLRNNITLEEHLRTHPKAKVIEALISVSRKNVSQPQLQAAPPQITIPPWQQTTTLQTNNSILVPVQSNNSSIIYQQFVSSNTTHNCLAPTMTVPQYITIPTNGFNQQPLIMNQQPYLYQHQQQQQVQLMSAPMVPVGYNYQTDPLHNTTSETVESILPEISDEMYPPIVRQPVISIHHKSSEPIKNILHSSIQSTKPTVAESFNSTNTTSQSMLTSSVIDLTSSAIDKSLPESNQSITSQSMVTSSVIDLTSSVIDKSLPESNQSITSQSAISEPLINKSTIISEPVIIKSTISEPLINKSTIISEPVIIKSTISEPLINKSTIISEPVIMKSTISEPVIIKSTTSEPVIIKPTISEPVIIKSTISEPVIIKSTISEPVINKSTISEPIINKSIIAHHVIKKSIASEPIVNKSIITQSIINKSMVSEPVIIKSTSQSIITQPIINKSTIISQPKTTILIEKSSSSLIDKSSIIIPQSITTTSLLSSSSSSSHHQQIDRSTVVCTTKKSNTPPVSVSTIQLADITISTEVLPKDPQKSSAAATNNEYMNSNQMEIIPIYNINNKKQPADHPLDPDDMMMDQSNIKSDDSEIKVNKKTVIEVYSNESTQHQKQQQFCEKLDLIETFHENEKHEDQIDNEEHETTAEPQDSDYILPDVSFYQISKFEDMTMETKESSRSLPETKNDIVIIKNEVISLPPTKITSVFQPPSSYNDEEQHHHHHDEEEDPSSFKVEHIESMVADDAYAEVVEFGDIKLMLNNDMLNPAAGGTTATIVNDLHCMEDIYDDDKSSPVLLNIGEIGGVVTNKYDSYHDENMMQQHEGDDAVSGAHENYSRDSLNIRADECMPPKGELSEQESNGAGDEEVWGKMFQEGSSGISTSYDLIARESWEASDSSDSELTPPLQSRISPADNNLSSKSQQLDPSKKVVYKCSYCKEIFNCPKERRVHQTNMHDHDDKTNYENDEMEDDGLEDGNQVEDCMEEECEEDNDTKNIKVEDVKIMEPTEPKIEVDPKINIQRMIQNAKLRHCELCLLEFETNDRFNEHYRIEHPTLPIPRYKCSTCQLTFTLECKFSLHLKIHPLVCQICYKLFYKQQSLQIHLRRVHLAKHDVTSTTGTADAKKYTCEVCLEKFTTYAQKIGHINSKHADVAATMFKCAICGEAFRRRKTLKQHRDSVHQKRKPQRDYVCHCGETFKSKNRYSWHAEIHETKPKACTFCSEKFVHTASLTRHIRIAHNENYIPDANRRVSENIACPICKKMYLKSSLDVHIKIHTGVKPFSCVICNKVFTTKWNLKLHKWTHAARLSKPYKCTQCQSAFIRQNDYVSHMNSHRNIKPYTCNHCGRQFIRKYNCQRHVREHERDKSYKCTVCNKEFHRSYYLREHLRVHSGDRPFSCHICGKTSTTKSNHNKHMRIHHARDPVSTEN